MRKQVEGWQKKEFTDVTVKVIIYEALLEGKLEAPKHFASQRPMKVTTTLCSRENGGGASMLQERDRLAWRRINTTLTTNKDAAPSNP